MGGRTLSRRRWLTWYGASFASAVVGSMLAYSQLLDSLAWRCWSTPTAWKRDAALAAVTFVLCLFVLWNMRAFDQEKGTLHKGFRPSFFLPYEWALICLACSILLLYTFNILPHSFENSLHAKMQAFSQKQGCHDLESAIAQNHFKQILRPYLPYSLNVFGLWGGMVLPLFLLIIRSVRLDWRKWKLGQSELLRSVANARLLQKDRNAALEGLIVCYQDQVIALKAVAERYLPVLLSVSLTLVYQQLTPSSEAETEAAVQSGKFAVWVLLGPVLITCVIVVAVGYQYTARRAEQGLRALAGSAAVTDSDLLKRIAEMRSKLIWDQSPGSFILSLAKSATISIPLFLAVIAYVLRLHSDGWLTIFVPEVLVKFFQGIFK